MTRLSHPIRGLLVAITALTLTAGAVFAARSLPSATTPAADHAAGADPVGGTIPAAAPNGTPEVGETPDKAEPPDTEDDAGAGNADRPRNHGWFVSQAANGDTPAGFDRHGAYVSSIARSDQGKPDKTGTGDQAPRNGKSAQAKAAHQP